MTCGYCLEALGGTSWTCPRCSITLHERCYREHGRCTNYSCSVVRWRHLTTKQKSRLVELGVLNGCGSKGGSIDVPEWIFEASCHQHDFNYWVGGAEADRLKADWEFYQAMLRDVDRFASWWNRWWYQGVAWVYYQAVRRYAGGTNRDGSEKHFAYGPKKTRADLEAVLAIES